MRPTRNWSATGRIRFVAAAAAYNRVSLNGGIVTHSGWGLSGRSNRVRQWQSVRDMSDIPASPQRFALRHGSRPMKLIGTLAEVSTGRMVNYLMSVPPQPNFPQLTELPQSMADGDTQQPQVSPPGRNRSAASWNMGSKQSLNRAGSGYKTHFRKPKLGNLLVPSFTYVG